MATAVRSSTMLLDVKPTASQLASSNSQLDVKPSVSLLDIKPGVSLLLEKKEAKEAEEPEVDIVINNVVCSFNVRCHLNLRDIALRGLNVEYRKENGVSMRKSSGGEGL